MLLNKTPVLVKGVFQKIPSSICNLIFDPLLPKGIYSRERMQSWGWQQFFTYVKLKKERIQKPQAISKHSKKSAASLKEKDLKQVIFSTP
jgi:hypothetical protein